MGVEGDAGLGEAFMQGAQGLDLLVASKDATLELEVVEAVALARRLGQAHDGLRREGFLMAQPRPGIVRIGFAGVRQVGQAAVAHVEQVPQHLDLLALLALAQERRDRDSQMLSQQVEQG